MFLKNEMKVKIFANNNDHWKLVLKARFCKYIFVLVTNICTFSLIFFHWWKTLLIPIKETF